MPRHGRSSPHPSDVLKVIGAPILHANADDPEAVVQAMIMAADWRTRYVWGTTAASHQAPCCLCLCWQPQGVLTGWYSTPGSAVLRFLQTYRMFHQ